MSKPVALILGAGKNIGATTAQLLQQEGYRVAQAARSHDFLKSADSICLKVDLASPAAVQDVFRKLEQEWSAPSLVIYNGAALTMAKPETFSPSIDDFTKDLTINTISVYAAAQAAVQGFKTLPVGPKTFILTGNCLNEGPLGDGKFLTLGVGKSASAHIIHSAAISYIKEGYKFYYVDERTADGSPMLGGVSGQGHAEFFAYLATAPDDVPWQATFVAGAGYTKFPL